MDESLSHDWRSYELYEKVRVRERRKKLIWISLTAIIFLSLSSITIFKNRMIKWKSLKQARILAIEIEKMKTLTIQKMRPMAITFGAQGELSILEVTKCQEGPLVGQVVEKLPWNVSSVEGSELTWIGTEKAKELKVAMVRDNICFDPVQGLFSEYRKQVIIIAPVKDLTDPDLISADQALSRAAFITLEGESAKISLN